MSRNDRRQLFRLIQGRLPDVSPRGLVRTFPATIAFMIAIIGSGLLTRDLTPAAYGRLLSHLGFDYALLREGHLWHPLTGTFVQSNPGIEVSMIALTGSSFLLCELLAGSLGLIVTLFACDWLSTIGAALLLRLLSAGGMQQASALLGHADDPASAAAHGAYAAAVALLLPVRLAVLAYSLLLGITITLLFQQQLTAAIAHLLAVLIGGALGYFALRGKDAGPVVL